MIICMSPYQLPKVRASLQVLDIQSIQISLTTVQCMMGTETSLFFLFVFFPQTMITSILRISNVFNILSWFQNTHYLMCHASSSNKKKSFCLSFLCLEHLESGSVQSLVIQSVTLSFSVYPLACVMPTLETSESCSVFQP